jgi:CRISPR-associated protein Csm1
MNDEVGKKLLAVTLAGLLHDMGKFAQRAGMEVTSTYTEDNAGLYQPYNREQNRHTHLHALYTAAFIERFAEYLPALDDRFEARSGDSLINLAAMHHKPETPLQWIVTQADRLGSGLDRQVFEGDEAGVTFRDFRKTRLIPLAEEMSRGKEFYQADTLETYHHRFRLGEMSPEQLFPVRRSEAEPAADAAAKSEYAALFDLFALELRKLEHREVPGLWIDHFSSLWERFASSIPAATVGKVIPDVSLYDHCRTSAALAGALYGYHARTGTLTDAAIRDNEIEKFLLVTSDFYGIQNFIFSEGGSTNRSAAKLLRGRSFAVSLLSELAADRLCKTLGLPATSVLLNAAGKFTLLAPNLPETLEAIKQVEEELNRWLVSHFYGEVTIGFSSCTACGGDLSMGKFPGLWERLGKAADAKKYRKLSLNDHAGVVANYLDSFDNTLGICPFCGKRPADPRTLGDGYLGENEAACFICRDQIQLGAQLIKARTVSVLAADAAFSGNRLKEPIFGCCQLSFDLDEKTSRKLAATGGLHRMMQLARTGEPLSSGLAVRFISGYVPVYTPEDEHDGRLLHGRMSEEKKLELIDMIREGGAKSFHHIAKAALNPSHDSDEKFTGVEALGVLKADVDNLGRLFACGLPPERLNLSRLATFSRQMNGYFSIYLPQLLAQDTRFRNIYTVFAGGDDLFLMGPWNRIIEFAPVLRKSFRLFSCVNPEITISAGITVDKPGVPVPVVAERAEEALKESKDAGRNRITLFGESVTWDGFEDLMQKRDALEAWQRQGYIGKAFLYRLNELMATARAEKMLLASGKPIDLDNMSCLAWRSSFIYSATRNVGKNLDKETRAKALDEVRHIAAWLHDLDGKLKIALWQVLYNQR